MKFNFKYRDVEKTEDFGSIREAILYSMYQAYHIDLEIDEQIQFIVPGSKWIYFCIMKHDGPQAGRLIEEKDFTPDKSN